MRRALIIGISAYEVEPLDNPVSDARLVKRTLEARGFRCELLEDPEMVAIDEGIERFTALMADADFAVVYVAGHGVEMHGAGYLLPREVPEPVSPATLQSYGVPVEKMIASMGTCSGPRIFIFDACRSAVAVGTEAAIAFGTLFDRERNAQRRWDNVLIGYSTSAGEDSGDGPGGKNSRYCAAFCEEVLRHGQTVEACVRNAGMAVMGATDRRQRPWYYSSLNDEPTFSDLPRFVALQSVRAPLLEGGALSLVKDGSNSGVLVFGSGSHVIGASPSSAASVASLHSNVVGAARTCNDDIVLVGADRALRCGDAPVGETRCAEPRGVRTSPDGATIAVYGAKSVEVFQVTDGEMRPVGYWQLPYEVYAALFVDERRLWLAGELGRITELTLKVTASDFRSLPVAGLEHIYDLCLAGPDAVACATGGGLIHLRDQKDGIVLREAIEVAPKLLTAAARRDQLVNDYPDETIFAFLFRPKTLTKSLRQRMRHSLGSQNLMCCDVSPGRPVLAAVGEEPLVHLLDIRTGDALQTVELGIGARTIDGLRFVTASTLAVLTRGGTVHFLYGIEPQN